MSKLTHNGPAESTEARTDASERPVAVHPCVDVLETENEFLIFADVPGVRPEDVDVRFEKGELAIHGRRPAGHEYGATAYQRSFAVDDTVSPDKIAAELKAGILTIHLPKIEAVKPKRITVSG
jgi:HSP20 family protein